MKVFVKFYLENIYEYWVFSVMYGGWRMVDGFGYF